MKSPQRYTRRPTRLGLEPLENRWTPATAFYEPATQTLSVVAAEGDQVIVSIFMGEPTGYIRVDANMTSVFKSVTNSQPVRNLTVHFEGVDNGELYLNPDVTLGGNVTVFGARDSQVMSNRSQIGGSLTYTDSGDANDTLEIGDTSRVGGNLKLQLGAGTNMLRLKGGFVGGNLSVQSGKGDDTIELAANDAINVGGSVLFRLGNGFNEVNGVGADPFDIGKSFAYVGGNGTDNLVLASIDLRTGSGASFLLGDAPAAGPNVVQFGDTNVGGDLKVAGGAHDDDVTLLGELQVGGGYLARLGHGDNTLFINDPPAGGNVIGGHLSYRGGAGEDYVIVDDTTIGKNASFRFGSSPTPQLLRIGNFDFGGVRVHGSLKFLAEGGDNLISLHRLYVGKNLNISTGDEYDYVSINDADIAGATSISLGGDGDRIEIELLSSDFAGILPGDTTFGGKFTLRAGDGFDLAFFSNDGNPATIIRFGSKVSLFGGAGNDFFENEGNEFLVTGNFENFDAGGGTLP
jgi:hypothetical protein